jgi:hypothetical protein
MMEAYEIDFLLLRELRAIQSQVAKEMDRVSRSEELQLDTKSNTPDAESVRNKLLEKLMGFRQNSHGSLNSRGGS